MCQSSIDSWARSANLVSNVSAESFSYEGMYQWLSGVVLTVSCHLITEVIVRVTAGFRRRLEHWRSYVCALTLIHSPQKSSSCRIETMDRIVPYMAQIKYPVNTNRVAHTSISYSFRKINQNTQTRDDSLPTELLNSPPELTTHPPLPHHHQHHSGYTYAKFCVRMSSLFFYHHKPLPVYTINTETYRPINLCSKGCIHTKILPFSYNHLTTAAY